MLPQLRLHAIFPEKTVANVLFLRVEVVQHHVGVAAVRGREDYYLEMLGKLFQNMLRIRPDIHAGLKRKKKFLP